MLLLYAGLLLDASQNPLSMSHVGIQRMLWVVEHILVEREFGRPGNGGPTFLYCERLVESGEG
jgi:hypothetical protein